MPRFVSVGEAIVELVGDVEEGFRFSFAGTALEMARAMRSQLDASWSIDFFTALGDDVYSQMLVDDLARSGIGIGTILKVPGRAIGLSLAESAGAGPIVTSWRSQAAARLMAEDPGAMAAALAGADMVYVSGAAFAILLPRARGRLLKALHRARLAGSRIVLAPHDWPDQWTSPRVRGSAINAIAMVADVVITEVDAERATFGEGSAEAIVERYNEWGVDDVLVGHGLNTDYLVAEAVRASPQLAARRIPEDPR